MLTIYCHSYNAISLSGKKDNRIRSGIRSSIKNRVFAFSFNKTRSPYRKICSHGKHS
jgi:hypothetical protein